MVRFATLFAPGLGLIALALLLDRGFDVVGQIARLAIPAGAGLATALVIYLLEPGRYLWRIGRGVRAAERDASQVLEPGEVLQALCPGQLLGPNRYSGCLLVTDRRLAFYQPTFDNCALATLTRREELSALARTQRHANRHPLWGLLLRARGRERCLTVTAADGSERAVVVERPLLDPLVAWLEAHGFEVGERNDEDLPAPPALARVTLVEHRVPAREWWGLWTFLAVYVAIAVLLLLLSTS